LDVWLFYEQNPAAEVQAVDNIQKQHIEHTEGEYQN
jgi:hypothetical protein